MHSVVFNPSGIRASVAAGATVLDAARAGGVDLDSVCGGRGLCGRCQVSPTDARVLSGPGPHRAGLPRPSPTVGWLPPGLPGPCAGRRG